MVEINKLADELSNYEMSDEGLPFEVQPIPGEVEVLQVLVEGREELPIFISYADREIICMSYLFKKDEVKDAGANEMNGAMLAINIAMPLSSFATVDDQYVVFGALSAESDLKAIVHEIEILSDNTMEAIDSLRDYLK